MRETQGIFSGECELRKLVSLLQLKEQEDNHMRKTQRILSKKYELRMKKLKLEEGSIQHYLSILLMHIVSKNIL